MLEHFNFTYNKYMKAVIQRVKQASVTISNEVVGKIGYGMLVLLAISNDDNDNTIKWMSNKLINLRIFPDENDKMNRSILDCKGEILLVSNFTLYGNVQKGYRPSFSESALPNISEPLYDNMVNYIKNNYNINIQTGRFGSMMDVELINDGPVTIIIEK